MITDTQEKIMHLKRLELVGFKSFADRIHLDLSPGLNAVVGPNGSGKSNIADALRWVLGEQSAKQLRGGKMEDIIFAGTAHRKPLGYAEIVMRLDNSDRKLPLEFHDISITRRVYRSGESEYVINGENCRLKDIQMLFMDTGIGRDGYSIVGQGRIDEILSLRSEDRRLVFEEAAGIGKFKARRNEALNKLEKERQNRARVDDIMTELEEQLEPLQIQSEEAKRFLALREQYKNVHVNIFLSEIQRIETDLKQVDEALNNGRFQAEDGRQRLLETRQAGEGLKSRATKADLQYRHASESLLETTTTIEKKESSNKLLESRLKQLEIDHSRLKAEVMKRELTISAKDEENANEYEKQADTLAELELLNQKLSELMEQSVLRDEELKESSSILDSYNQTVMDAMNDVTEARSHVLESENDYRRLEENKERLDTELEHHKTNIEVQATFHQEIETYLKTCVSNIFREKSNVETYTSAYNQLVEEQQNLEKERRQVQETLTTARGNYRALSNLESQYEGYYRSVKAVLRKKNNGLSGICGAVGELITVDRKYEVAIETALGGSAQSIITKTENDAKLAIEMLKQSKEGRATFLPLDAVRGKEKDSFRYKNENGYIGLATELINYDSEYSQIMTQLLGDILIVDTMDNALVLNRKYNYSNKIVTLDGERLSPGGAITGGSSKSQTSGIIGRGQQIEALKTQIEALERKFTNLSESEQSTIAKRQATEETLNQAREKLQTLRIEEQNQNNKLIQVTELCFNLEKKALQLEEENDNILAQLAETNLQIRLKKGIVAEKEELVQTARFALENYRREMEQSRLEHSEEADTLTNLRIEVSRRTEWINQAETNIKRLEREITTLQEEKKLILEEIKANDVSAQQTETERKMIITETTLLKSQVEKIRTKLSIAEKEKSMLDEAINSADSDERAQQDSLALLDKELTRLEMRKEQLEATSHRLHNEIWEEYNLTHQQAQMLKREDVNDSTLRREGQELRAELATLTNVNVGAIEAYSQMKTRYDFLNVQREDILVAEASLDELINNLTSQMENQFATQFQLIAKHFSEVFKEMFGGGKADLRLMDTTNVLESGIEITAQPPGKALQNLMLLSGGERALTAIALLFAILRLKPSPFCVLDEIESALDDANVARFAKFLKEYATGTQFIIITHRRGTMEAADHMYGVTMEEQGISKLVSVRFTES